MDAIALLIAVITLAAGFAAGWALARGRSAGTLAERDAARAETETLRGERDRAVAEIRAERDLLSEQLRAAESAATEATARLDSERTSAAEKLQLLEQAQEQIKDSFSRLSQDALRKNNEQFLELADTRFKQAGAPLTETLSKVEIQLREIEKSRAGAQQALIEQIERVRLSGEELTGMTDRCDFTEQTTVTTSDGSLRPDLVVRIVGGKSIVVDSKVTLAAYLEAHDATDDVVRDERLTAHARHLRTHVDQLAAKSYWSQFSPAPEFVVLFVPGDAFLAAALDRDPSILDDAFTKRVHIATPTTLISVLRTCAYAWQQDALAENAREVFDLGRELYSRIGKLGARVDTLGKRLGSAVGAYNETVASLESRVLPQARKLKDLKVVDIDLAAPTPIEEAVRPVAAAELVASVEQARAVVPLPAVAVAEAVADAAAAADAMTETVTDAIERAEDYGLLLDTSAADKPGRATG
jgi:DNA recombination protein RmuC